MILISTKGRRANERSAIRQIGYTWDERNRLTQIKQGSTSVASFAYDPFGRRIISKTGGDATIKYLYDGINLTQELVSTQQIAEHLRISKTNLTVQQVEESKQVEL